MHMHMHMHMLMLMHMHMHTYVCISTYPSDTNPRGLRAGGRRRALGSHTPGVTTRLDEHVQRARAHEGRLTRGAEAREEAGARGRSGGRAAVPALC